VCFLFSFFFSIRLGFFVIFYLHFFLKILHLLFGVSCCHGWQDRVYRLSPHFRNCDASSFLGSFVMCAFEKLPVQIWKRKKRRIKLEGTVEGCLI
jgi:hypothetical protein